MGREDPHAKAGNPERYEEGTVGDDSLLRILHFLRFFTLALARRIISSERCSRVIESQPAWTKRMTRKLASALR